MTCYSARQVNEWETYIWKNGRQDHQEGFHDDAMMSVIMALWISQNVYHKLEKAEKVHRTVLSAFLGLNLSKEDIERRKIENKKKQALHRAYGDHGWVMQDLFKP